MGRIRVYSAVILAVILAFHLFAPPLESESRRLDDIREAVFRHQFHAHGLHPKLCFLSLDDGRDPSDAFLRRFWTMPGRVKKVSQSKHVDPFNAVVDKQSGQRGVIFFVDNISWISQTEVTTGGGYYFDGKGAAFCAYTVVYRFGHWRVVKDEIHGIS